MYHLLLVRILTSFTLARENYALPKTNCKTAFGYFNQKFSLCSKLQKHHQLLLKELNPIYYALGIIINHLLFSRRIRYNPVLSRFNPKHLFDIILFIYILVSMCYVFYFVKKYIGLKCVEFGSVNWHFMEEYLNIDRYRSLQSIHANACVSFIQKCKKAYSRIKRQCLGYADFTNKMLIYQKC